MLWAILTSSDRWRPVERPGNREPESLGDAERSADHPREAEWGARTSVWRSSAEPASPSAPPVRRARHLLEGWKLARELNRRPADRSLVNAAAPDSSQNERTSSRPQPVELGMCTLASLYRLLRAGRVVPHSARAAPAASPLSSLSLRGLGLSYDEKMKSHAAGGSPFLSSENAAIIERHFVESCGVRWSVPRSNTSAAVRYFAVQHSSPPCIELVPPLPRVARGAGGTRRQRRRGPRDRAGPSMEIRVLEKVEPLRCGLQPGRARGARRGGTVSDPRLFEQDRSSWDRDGALPLLDEPDKLNSSGVGRSAMQRHDLRPARGPETWAHSGGHLPTSSSCTRLGVAGGGARIAGLRGGHRARPCMSPATANTAAIPVSALALALSHIRRGSSRPLGPLLVVNCKFAQAIASRIRGNARCRSARRRRLTQEPRACAIATSLAS